MTPPDRPKRPSARPAARKSAPPGASKKPVTSEGSAAKQVTKQVKPVKKAERPRVAARRTSVPPPPEPTREAASSAQVQAAAKPARAGARGEEAAASKERSQTTPKSAGAGSARPSAPPRARASERPSSRREAEAAREERPLEPARTPQAAAQPKPVEAAEEPARVNGHPGEPEHGESALAETEGVNGVARHAPLESAPVPRPSTIPEEDDDIWRDAAPDPAFVPQAADEDPAPALEERTREFPRLTPASRLARGSSATERGEATLIGSTQSLLSTDYYFRQYGAHGMRRLSADVDDFGLDPHVEERARPVLEALCKGYFRVSVDGAQNLPERGRALIVANRSGTVPWDGLVLRTALRMKRPELPPVRWLSEDSVFHYPFLGVFMNRLGAVRACPENAERLLSQDKLVAVFPEGAQGSSKLFRERYRLQRFGRGGYVRLALKLGAPVIPTAIIGAEETNPLLGRSRLLGKVFGADYLPITPTFPWLGPVGLMPVPVKWRILVGEPIDLSSYGPEAAEDSLLVHRLNEQIRGILQTLVDQGRSSRRSVLFG